MKMAGFIVAGYLILVGVGEYTISSQGTTGVLASIGSFPSPGSALSGDISTAAMIDIGFGAAVAGLTYWYL